jgi:hypothetical protein
MVEKPHSNVNLCVANFFLFTQREQSETFSLSAWPSGLGRAPLASFMMSQRARIQLPGAGAAHQTVHPSGRGRGR